MQTERIREGNEKGFGGAGEAAVESGNFRMESMRAEKKAKAEKKAQAAEKKVPAKN